MRDGSTKPDVVVVVVRKDRPNEKRRYILKKSVTRADQEVVLPD